MLPGQKLVNGHISVEPLPPLWLLYCKSAERVHRPGSRRLGGVEATGASPGVAPSRPHRSGPRAGPGRRTPCARGAWGGERAGGLGLRLACPREVRTGAGPCPSSNCFRQFKRGGRGSDAGRGSRRRDLHPKGDVCAGHKLASDIRWLYLLLAACAPVHAPLTRGHRLPPGTSGPSGSPAGARP